MKGTWGRRVFGLVQVHSRQAGRGPRKTYGGVSPVRRLKGSQIAIVGLLEGYLRVLYSRNKPSLM